MTHLDTKVGLTNEFVLLDPTDGKVRCLTDSTVVGKHVIFY